MERNFRLNPPAAVNFELFDRGRDVYGNPTAHYLLTWNNGKTGAEYEGDSYRTRRRVQVGYGDKSSGGALGLTTDLFPGAWFELESVADDPRADIVRGTLARHPEKESIPVIYRTESNGDVCAFFPTLPADRLGHEVTCYAHMGQHSGATLDYYRTTKPARDDSKVDALRRELESLGYRLNRVERMTPTHHETRAALAA